MCGIFYIRALEENINKINNNILNIIEKINYRGPDKTVKILHNNFLFIHTLLAIQGFNPQPSVYKNKYLLYNGEIYGTSKSNPNIQPSNKNFKFCENIFLHNYFEKYNFTNLENIDGEYIINYIDFENNNIHIITDPFGTKPFCFYVDDETFIASSYESCIKNTMDILDITGQIHFVIPNTHYIFDLNKNKLISKNEIVKWDFTPRFNNFDRWNIAFDNAIKKRTNTDKKIFVPLSSGYDSGCIVSSLINLDRNFETYTFKGIENTDILNKREEIINKKNNFSYVDPNICINENYEEYFCRIENYTAYHLDGTPYCNIYDAYSCFGLYNIFKEARKDDQIIFLSGHGGDEIFSDYGNTGNITASVLELDYSNVRSKWPNFDSGYGRNVLQMFERVSGSYGIEARYPYLDKQVVQEFLWLNDELKNSDFKQCLAQYMRKFNFPFLENEKCQVLVLEQEDGGNKKFKEIVKEVKNKNNYDEIVYPKYNYDTIDKKIFRPNLDYKPNITYYP